LFNKIGCLVHKIEEKSEEEILEVLLDLDVDGYEFVDTSKTEIKILALPNPFTKSKQN